MSRTSWWVESGMAAEAARELMWFVVLIVVGIGLMIWRDIRNDKKEKKDD